VREFQLVLYGSYGYTGELIALECKRKNLSVLLAGRNEGKLKEQSTRIGFPYQIANVDDHAQLVDTLKRASLLIHCAGPFQYTASRVVQACLDASAHYTDITGEYEVFELLANYDEQAKAKKSVIMPGVGFDVVPSDCLALYLKNRLPSATHLQLAFTMGKGGLSRGTSKTMIEGMGNGSCVREAGTLKKIALGKSKLIDFGTFSRNALCIPWGDIATAWRSTGIPNIEVYSGVSTSAIRAAKFSNYISWVLKFPPLKKYLKKKIDEKPAGPSETRRNESRSFLWGTVRDFAGNTCTARLETINGYSLTAKAAVLIAEKILNAPIKTGYSTPAQYFGADLILEIESTTRVDVN
jgi:short subunit dehydrogenase-like uncharacterized protein